MDCSNARLFLRFARPSEPGELDSDSAAALDGHLARCAECAALAQGERRLDQQLGRAMHQVEVPPNLRGLILARLAAERQVCYRRWLAHGLRGAAAAAVLLLAVWGWWTWWGLQAKPELDLAAVLEGVKYAPHPEEVRDSLGRLGVEVRLPDNVNYAFLTGYGVSELPGMPGKAVAQLDFLDNQAPGSARKGDPPPVRRARVYIVSAKDFNLKSLKDSTPSPESEGYRYKRHPNHYQSGDFAYLIFYTGDSDEWLFVRQQ